MRIRQWLFWVLMILLVLEACSVRRHSVHLSLPEQVAQTTDLTKVNPQAFRPVLWGYNVAAIKKTFSNGQPVEHPLHTARTAFGALYYGRQNHDTTLLHIGKAYLDSLINYPHQMHAHGATIYAYPKPHQELPAGWWSGMANATVALAFLMGAQTFNSKAYLERSQQALKGVTNSITQNGSAMHLDKGATWYLEYSHGTLKKKTAHYVLNGFIYQLLILRILDQVHPDGALLTAYTKGKQAYRLQSPLFYYPENAWTFYMLEPKTPESLHYTLFDVLVLESLLPLDTDPFFEREINKRRHILATNFAVYELANDATGYSYAFPLLGPPHPYWLDTYIVHVDLFNKGQQVGSLYKTGLRNLNVPFVQRAFAIDTLSTSADSFRASVIYLGDSLLFGAGKIESADKDVMRSIPITKITPMENGGLKNGQLILYPDTSPEPKKDGFLQCIWEFQLKEPIDLSTHPYIGIKVKTDIPIYSTRINLITSEGNEITRTYLPLEGDTTNLLLVHWVGFKDIEQLRSLKITAVKLYLHPLREKLISPTPISVSPVLSFPGPMSVCRFFLQEPFFFPEKVKYRKEG